MQGVILIVDDKAAFVRHMAQALEHEGYRVEAAHTLTEARAKMLEVYPDVVLMDLNLPDGDGSEFMARIRGEQPQAEFIIVTGHGSIKSAIESTRLGAVDYLTKPFLPEELILSIDSIFKKRSLDDEIRLLRSGGAGTHPRGKSSQEPFPSAAMRHVFARALQAAKLDTIILLLGDSGVGKDYLASWIHSHSRRSDGPYFSINCASIAHDLFESEIFGYEPGAFTGAKGRKRGLLELAQKGTLVLNEIGELDLSLQSKLLSFLDTRSFLRVGGERSVSVDIRIIAATNRDLQGEVIEGKFRRDLFYRLSVFPIVIPPLGERSEDIPVLVDRLLPDLAVQMGMTHRPALDPATLVALQENPWPGNVRELINVLERALILAGEGTIMPWHVGQGTPPSSRWKLEIPFPEGRNLHDITSMVTRELIQEALRRTRGNRGHAASLLGISRHALAYQMRAVGISSGEESPEA